MDTKLDKILGKILGKIKCICILKCILKCCLSNSSSTVSLRYHSFQHKKHTNSTELSKHIWELKKNNKRHNIKWSTETICNLCLSEKLCIIKAHSSNLLNERDEMISNADTKTNFTLRTTRTKLPETNTNDNEADRAGRIRQAAF